MKEFKIEGRTYFLKNPTNNSVLESEANIYSARIFAKLAKAKDDDGEHMYMMRSQLEDFLKDVGVYSEDELDAIMQFNKEIGELEKKIKDGGDIDGGKAAAVRLKTVRINLLMLISRKFEYDKYTIEHNVENAKFDYLITKCILDEDKKPVFKNVEDYKDNEELREDLMPLIKELGELTSPFDSQFEQKLPENQFLKKYDFCDDNFNLKEEQSEEKDSDADEVLVGEFKEQTKKPTRKRAPKKKTAVEQK